MSAEPKNEFAKRLAKWMAQARETGNVFGKPTGSLNFGGTTVAHQRHIHPEQIANEDLSSEIVLFGTVITLAALFVSIALWLT